MKSIGFREIFLSFEIFYRVFRTFFRVVDKKLYKKFFILGNFFRALKKHELGQFIVSQALFFFYFEPKLGNNFFTAIIIS